MLSNVPTPIMSRHVEFEDLFGPMLPKTLFGPSPIHLLQHFWIPVSYKTDHWYGMWFMQYSHYPSMLTTFITAFNVTRDLQGLLWKLAHAHWHHSFPVPPHNVFVTARVAIHQWNNVVSLHRLVPERFSSETSNPYHAVINQRLDTCASHSITWLQKQIIHIQTRHLVSPRWQPAREVQDRERSAMQ